MKNNIKFVELSNGYRIRIKETNKVNEKFILTLQDANYNKIAELKCGFKDYDKTLKKLSLLAEDQVNDNEKLIYKDDITLDKNNKPDFKELKNLEEEIGTLLNKLEKEESKLEEPKVEEPKVEEPKTEESKLEEPKVEEPKVEEPKVEEPKTEESKVEEPKVEEPKTENLITKACKAVINVISSIFKAAKNLFRKR